MSSIVKSLLWRSALKSFIPHSTTPVDISSVLEAIRLAPSAFGVQPYHVHVVQGQELKDELRSASFDQPQVSECSNLLVFCARNDASPSVERFLTASNISISAPKFADSIRDSLSSKNTKEFLEWATNQAYIALGVGVTACADMRIGSCPMGGFVPADVHRILKLPAEEWPVAYLAIGSKLDMGKKNARKKFRFPLHEIVKYHR